jgi:hypothetical protein
VSIRSFLPFIVFAAPAGSAWQWAAVAAFVIGVRILMEDRKAGTPNDALIPQYSNCAYFAIPFAFTTQYPKVVRARMAGNGAGASNSANVPAAAL